MNWIDRQRSVHGDVRHSMEHLGNRCWAESQGVSWAVQRVIAAPVTGSVYLGANYEVFSDLSLRRMRPWAG